MSGTRALAVPGSVRVAAISTTVSVAPEQIPKRADTADATASHNPAESPALPPYFQSLIRQNQETGAATSDWEDRIRERLATLEAVLDYGIR